VLAGVILRFHYLGKGLSLLLGFVGLKMLLSGMCELPMSWSLAIVALLIAGSMLLSLRHRPLDAANGRGPPARLLSKS
jgi:tellurite resistance protein TerC